MAFDFPTAPALDQTYTSGGVTFKWNGYAWDAVSGGGSALVPTDDSPPAVPLDGQLWWKSSNGVPYIWYDDGDSQQWVQFAGGGVTTQDPFVFPVADMALLSRAWGKVCFNDKPDGTGTDVFSFDKLGTFTVTQSILMKGKGTTPREYTIQSVDGVLSIGNGGGRVNFSDTVQLDARYLEFTTVDPVFWRKAGTGSFAWYRSSDGTGAGTGQTLLMSVDNTGAFTTQNGISTNGGVSATGQIATTSNIRGNLGVYANSDASLGMLVSGATRYMMMIGTTWTFNCNAANGDCSWMQPGGYGWFSRASDAAFIIRAQAYKPGGGPWADASDARIKTVLRNYERGLDQIVALQPVRYTFKGNDTDGAPENKPEPPEMNIESGEMVTVQSEEEPTVPYWNSPHRMAAEDGTEFIGLVAQDTEKVMPELVNRVSAYIDGEPVTDLRNLDTAPLVFALINAIKTLASNAETLAARVEALEASNGV
jgi:hypothetical protein